jgi:hypothetical protein
MKTENCSNGEVPCEWKDPEEHRPSGFIIWAGILMGLGAGLLADQMGTGFLIGLGLGLVGSELLPHVWKPLEGQYQPQRPMNLTTLLIGAFLICIGVSIVWAPVAIWPYVIAGFLFLMGISFLIRGFRKSS